jgi:carboxylate-amine ligase
VSSSYTFGIEEEYFVFRRKTGDAQDSMSSLFFESAKQSLGERVTRELLQSQIEVATTPCSTSADGRDQLMECRNTLQDLAADQGLGILAAGTHPSAGWADLKPTEMPR